MIVVQVRIEVRGGAFVMLVEQLTREDANTEEREIAQAVEEWTLALSQQIAEHVGVELKITPIGRLGEGTE